MRCCGFFRQMRAQWHHHLILTAKLCMIVSAQGQNFPASKPESGPTFNFSAWRKEVAQVDHQAWEKMYPGPFGSWFSPTSDDCAKGYDITWGPLGIRTHMHDHTWAGMPAFRKMWPECLLDLNGDLLFDCFEVLSVAPGSPADGHLQPGDLLLAMDGEPFRTALALRPNAPLLHHQDTRSLEMDAGEKLDRAEGRGRVSFDIIRPSAGKAERLQGEMVKELQVGAEMPHGGNPETEIDVPVAEGQEITTYLELTRGHNGSCGSFFIKPRLEGPAGRLDLTHYRPISEVAGYGSVTRGTDASGNPVTHKGSEVKEVIQLHAPGQIGWGVPKGYNRFRTTVVANPNANGFRAKVTNRITPRGLPAKLASQATTVSFNIPKIGSYARGFPNNGDAKSAMVAKMTAAWLADQQQPDGSWLRTCGYTHAGYDTAWAALGLLAHGDPAYDGHIRKAVEFLAFRSPQDHWAVPTSMMIACLSEYYLKTGDKSILVALQSQVERLQAQMIYGDWNSGHGATPGYRGTGVSIGGSHAALALALANLTPVKVEPGLVDRMLARAQELAPSGFIPYGRGTTVRTFEPDLKSGGTYSGRHAPYLVASLIHGGPRLFTKNCSALYSDGAVGGIDQGHATQSLSTGWGLIAAAMVDPQALERQMEALRWKFTILRNYHGGFGWNAYRLEYMGGEGLLPNYLRSGNYLVALSAHKKNIALTGNPKYRAKEFPDLPPVCDADAVALRYYQRNWGIIASVLGNNAPPALGSGLKRLLDMGKGKDTRAALYGFLQQEAPSVAKDLLALKNVEPIEKQYYAEMVLGVDIRLNVDPTMTDDKVVDGQWTTQVDAQYPFAGYFAGATPEERQKWRSSPPLAMEGSVEIIDASGKRLGELMKFDRDCGNNEWQTNSISGTFSAPTVEPLPLTARVRYQVGDMTFSYDRPISGGAPEEGSAEKLRKITNDRVIPVRGRLYRDLSDWSTSFVLPSGQFIATASQGGGVRVQSDNKLWSIPRDGVLPAGSECEFGFTSGWQPFEGRVGLIRLVGKSLHAPIASLKADRTALDLEPLSDHQRGAGQSIPLPGKKGQPLVLDLELKAPAKVRAIDMRLKDNPRDFLMTVEAEKGNSWQTIFQGRPSERSCPFDTIETKRLRIHLTPTGDNPPPILLEEFTVITAAQ